MVSLPSRTRLRGTLLGVALVGAGLGCQAPQSRDQVRIVHRGGDLFGAGDTVEVADSVPGDAMLAGSQLEFSGATGGDYLGAGGSQMITGRIHGSARVAGGTVRLASAVDRNATIAGGTIRLDRTATIGRNAYLAGGTVRVDGTVRQSLRVTGGTVMLDGAVDGDVNIAGGELRIGPGANIGGDLRYRVPSAKVHIDSAARIGGTVTALPPRDWSGVVRAFRLMWLLGFLLAGVVAVALAPRFAAAAAEWVGARPGLSALLGVLWLVVIPVVAVLVATTVIGLPLALLAGAAYLLLVYLGRVVLAVWLGRLLLGGRVRDGTTGALMSFLLGAIILVLLALVPLLGLVVTLVATVVGLGALLIQLRSWTRAPAAE